ncbi:MAG: hypothetical protein K8U57_05040 [Planctomycetes bacterium]|nr:hypothetical protein [Planctomycetota bacterium]
MTEQPENIRERIRIDSFEIVEADCDLALSEEQKTWPVSHLRSRVDGGELLEAATPEPPELVIRVPYAASATPAEVMNFVEQVRTALANIPLTAGMSFPIQITVPGTTP